MRYLILSLTLLATSCASDGGRNFAYAMSRGLNDFGNSMSNQAYQSQQNYALQQQIQQQIEDNNRKIEFQQKMNEIRDNMQYQNSMNGYLQQRRFSF